MAVTSHIFATRADAGAVAIVVEVDKIQKTRSKLQNIEDVEFHNDCFWAHAWVSD